MSTAEIQPKQWHSHCKGQSGTDEQIRQDRWKVEGKMAPQRWDLTKNTHKGISWLKSSSLLLPGPSTCTVLSFTSLEALAVLYQWRGSGLWLAFPRAGECNRFLRCNRKKHEGKSQRNEATDDASYGLLLLSHTPAVPHWRDWSQDTSHVQALNSLGKILFSTDFPFL